MRFLTMMTAAICLAGSAAVAEVYLGNRTIVVQGEGQVSVVPDMAQVSIGVEARAANAAEAMVGTSGKMATLMAVATEAGVEARDLQTSNLNLHTDVRHTSGNAPQVVGYIATNMLTIRLRDLDSAPQILDQLVSAGANQLHGVQFTVQDPKPHLDEARQLAVADALAKAALYAQAAGVETGDVLRIEEPQSGGGGVYPMARMEMAASVGVPMAAGEQNISASIRLVFAIAPDW